MKKIWELSQSEAPVCENNRKGRNNRRGLKLLLAAALALSTGACSQSAGSPNAAAALLLGLGSGAGTGGVQIRVGAQGLSAADIEQVNLAVSAADMPTPIDVTLVQVGATWQGNVAQIPAGINRTFTVTALDASDAPIYQGQASGVSIVANETAVVMITMQETNPPAPFANAAPIIDQLTASAASVVPGASIQLAAVAHDPNVGDALTYSWTASGGSYSDSAATNTTWTAPATPGTYTLVLTVTDPYTLATAVSLTVAVTAGSGSADVQAEINTVPVIQNITTTVTTPDRGQAVPINATISDPDGDVLMYAWTASCAGSFDDDTIAAPTFTVGSGADYGACTFAVAVSDGRGGNNTGSLQILIATGGQTNFAPELLSPLQSATEAGPGASVTFRISARDPEGGALTFQWSHDSAGSLSTSTETTVGANTVSEVVLTAGSCEEALVTVEVEDSVGLLSSFAFLPVQVSGCITTVWNSRTHDGSAPGSYSHAPDATPDGRYVVFKSNAGNMVAGDTNNALDVFMRDEQLGTTTRVSVASDGSQGDAASEDPEISADGRFVAFESYATNLVSGDTNGARDIFVRDLVNGTTTRVSVASDGSQADSGSSDPSISDDGRYVVFQSDASSLGASGSMQIFLHDRQNGTTVRISNAPGGTAGDNASAYPAISADGNFVAFQSLSSNLVTGDTNADYDAFVYDIANTTITRVSVASDGSEVANSTLLMPEISADGRYVAFRSSAANLVSGDTNGVADIFVHDRQTGSTTRVSVATDGTQGNDAASLNPTISGDGRYVAFASAASNLVPGDTNNGFDIFVHDRLAGTTMRVSIASDGEERSGDSFFPRFTATGHVTFVSTGALVPVSDVVAGGSQIFTYGPLP